MSKTNNTTTRIAKNAVALYIRSFIVMLISLYTSRVILRVLGVDDLGIYNLVGGMVMMFAFLDGGQNQTYQRFFNYSMGKPDEYFLPKVFSTSINVQLLIAGTIFLLCEIIGLFLLYNHLVIPDGRMTAAFWVFQFSTLTLVINTISIPFSALIIAHEDLRAFAYIDIINVVFKLLIVFVIEYVSYDRLIIYAILLFVVQLATQLAYAQFCKTKYRSIRYRPGWDSRLTKEMASFSGWIVLSSVASIFLTQGISILYNLYYGVVANAAIGIGNQVRSAVLKLTGNLTMSFGPQLVINYANGDWGKVNKIWTIGNKVALGLFAAVAIPIIIDADYILEIWLEKPPKYTAIFLRLILIENLIRFLAAYASTVIRATGRIKKYELISNMFNVLAFVLIIIGFKTVDSIKLPYFILIFTTIIQITYSTFLACNCINYNSKKYFVSNTGLSLIALIVAVTIGIITMPSSFTVLKLLFHCALVAISVIISLYYIGLLPHERDYINITAKNIILKKWIK